MTIKQFMLKNNFEITGENTGVGNCWISFKHKDNENLNGYYNPYEAQLFLTAVDVSGKVHTSSNLIWNSTGFYKFISCFAC